MVIKTLNVEKENLSINNKAEKKPLQKDVLFLKKSMKENGPSKKKVDNKKKEKDFNSKKEDQEMISLEKAAAQKHKKRSQKEEAKEAVTQIVVNQPMTIQELADKIQKLQLK